MQSTEKKILQDSYFTWLSELKKPRLLRLKKKTQFTVLNLKQMPERNPDVAFAIYVNLFIYLQQCMTLLF